MSESRSVPEMLGYVTSLDKYSCKSCQSNFLMDRINENYRITEQWTTISVIFRLRILSVQDVSHKSQIHLSSLCGNYAEDTM